MIELPKSLFLWRKNDLYSTNDGRKLCLFDGKKIYTQQMTEVRFFVVASIPWEKWSIYSGQSDTEGTMINQLQYELQFDPSIVVLLLVSIEWNDGSAKRKQNRSSFKPLSLFVLSFCMSTREFFTVWRCQQHCWRAANFLNFNVLEARDL